ncbi:hypothetical protein Trydic_g20983 [Trypoxylus dichotomus]
MEAFKVGNIFHKRLGAARAVRSPANVETVQASVLRSPRRSASKHTAALGLTDRSTCRILYDNLHFHPYKMVVAQQLSERELVSRQTACEMLLENLLPHFHNSDCVSKQNMHYWSSINLREIHERPLYSDWNTVWAAQ